MPFFKQLLIMNSVGDDLLGLLISELGFIDNNGFSKICGDNLSILIHHKEHTKSQSFFIFLETAELGNLFREQSDCFVW